TPTLPGKPQTKPPSCVSRARARASQRPAQAGNIRVEQGFSPVGKQWIIEALAAEVHFSGAKAQNFRESLCRPKGLRHPARGQIFERMRNKAFSRRTCQHPLFRKLHSTSRALNWLIWESAALSGRTSQCRYCRASAKTSSRTSR